MIFLYCTCIVWFSVLALKYNILSCYKAFIKPLRWPQAYQSLYLCSIQEGPQERSHQWNTPSNRRIRGKTNWLQNIGMCLNCERRLVFCRPTFALACRARSPGIKKTTWHAEKRFQGAETISICVSGGLTIHQVQKRKITHAVGNTVVRGVTKHEDNYNVTIETRTGTLNSYCKIETRLNAIHNLYHFKILHFHILYMEFNN